MTTKEMVYAALFAAVIAVLGLIPPIPLGFIPAPITAQTLGVMLAGGFLGKRVGVISLLLFLVLVALGLPLLSGGRGGVAVFAGPTVGYLISWPIAVFCIGLLVEKLWSSLNVWKVVVVNVVFGALLVSCIGAPIMAMVTNTPVWATLTGAVVYLPGDIIKAVIAALIVVQLKVLSPIGQRVEE